MRSGGSRPRVSSGGKGGRLAVAYGWPLEGSVTFAIPKHRVRATIHLEGDGPREVDLFLADSIDGYRPERPSDVLASSQLFIPVTDAEGGGLRIVQRAAILIITVAAEVEATGELSVEDLAAGLARKSAIEVRVRGGVTLRGTVVYVLPEAQQRLVDFANQTDALLSLRDGDVVHLVPKAHVVDIRPTSVGT